MSGWVWIDTAVVLALHDEQLAEHGGAAGVRDRGLLESALARPQNVAAYDVAALAAAYAFGIARNNPFIDGNKRTALVALGLFLELNGNSLASDDAERVDIMMRLACGELAEAELAGWIRGRLRSA